MRAAMTTLLLVDNLGRDDKWGTWRGWSLRTSIPAAFLNAGQNDGLPEVDAIIHLGACSATTERDADYLLENNYRYTRTLCEWSVRMGRASSMPPAPRPTATAAGVQRLTTAEGAAAAQHVRILQAHVGPVGAKQGYFDRIVGLKYFNVYGPHEEPQGRHAFDGSQGLGADSADGEGATVQVVPPGYADGEQMRDFIYVQDAVARDAVFLEHREVGGLFNCGTGKARTWKDLMNAAVQRRWGEPQIDSSRCRKYARQVPVLHQAEISKLRAAG